MNRILNSTLAFAYYVSLTGCADNAVNPQSNPLALTVETVNCTELFLKLSLAASETQRVLTLNRGNSTIATITLAGNDSVFVDDELTPSTTYAYTLISGKWKVNAQATTMDTTAHSWTWEVDKIGIAYTYLYDIAIVNDTLAYAGGDIYLNDSTGKFDQQPYGMVEWNGKEWTSKRLYAFTQEGYLDNIRPIKGICAFSTTDIWLANGNAYRWNGQSDQLIAFWISGYQGNPNPVLGPNQGVNRLCGTSDNNIYGGGANGGLAHYNGTSWRNISTNLTTDIHDVWGGSRSTVGYNVQLAAMCNKYWFGDARVLSISSSGTLDSIRWGMQFNPPYSVWYDSTSQIYVCGGGIFRLQNGSWVSMANGLPSIFLNRVRGNGDNDLVVVGDFGVVAHYNGVSWQVYSQLQLPNGNYESIAIKNNLAIAVGWNNGQGYIAVGRR